MTREEAINKYESLFVRCESLTEFDNAVRLLIDLIYDDFEYKKIIEDAHRPALNR